MIIDKKISELLTTLEKSKGKAIVFETVGAVSIKIVLDNPQYKFIEKINYIQLYDAKTNVKVCIDIYTATQLDKEELEYKIMLDNSQRVNIKII